MSQKSEPAESVFWQEASFLGPDPHLHAPLMQMEDFEQLEPELDEVVVPELLPDVPSPDVPELLVDPPLVPLDVPPELLVLPLLQPAVPMARVAMAMAKTDVWRMVMNPSGGKWGAKARARRASAPMERGPRAQASAYASMGGQAQINFRSPSALFRRPTAGQNLRSRVQGAGNAAISRV